MKKFLTIISVLMLAAGLSAKPEKGGKKGGGPEGRPSREEVMKKFDKDGDGKLSEEERAAARKSMGARRGGARGAGKGEDGRKKDKATSKKGKRPAAK